jgi:4-amino-4-deoxy-L-arabinose transferase-like glycosyltransferase
MILGLALLVRALCWLPGASHPERFFNPDSHGYVALASDLHAGYLDPQSPTFVTGLVRPPAYASFLAPLLRIFRGSVRAVIAVQIGVSLFTVWLTCVLATRLVGDRSALASGLVLALDPASALFSCLLLTETLFTALLVAGAVFWQAALQRGALGQAAGAGVMLGVAALTRPIGLFLPLWLAPAIWLRRDVRQRVRILLCFLLASAIPVGAWMAKNSILIGFPVFSIAGDSSLLHYRAAGALALDERISLDEARTRVWQRFWKTAPVGASVAELSQRQRTLALQILAEHPWGTTRMVSDAVLQVVAGTALSNLAGDRDPVGVRKPGKRALQALELLALGVVYLAVARGMLLLVARRELFAIALPLGVIVYLALLSAGPEANARFRVPAVPFLAILAGHGLSSWFVRRPTVEPTTHS